MLKAVEKADLQMTEVHPGLAAANAAADAAVQKYGDLLARIRDAEMTLKEGIAERDDLVRKTVAGEAVPAERTFEVETRIRSAEATAGLLREALPAVAEQVEQAESAIAWPIRATMQKRLEAAAKRRKDAQGGYKAAGDELAAAGVAFYEAERWAGLSGEILVLDQSPESGHRRSRWADMKRAR
jgi:hypothetical protein